MKVLSVKPNPKNPKQGFVSFDDKTEAWTPEIALVKPLVGKEIPEGWAHKDNKAGTGKVFLPPQDKRGGSNWYNSEAGVRFTQERMDRRTALMQAVAQKPESVFDDVIERLAESYYTWLRKNLDVPEGPRVSTRERGSAGAGTASAQGPPSGTSGEEGASAIVNPPSTEHSPEDAPEGEERETGSSAEYPSRRTRRVENQP